MKAFDMIFVGAYAFCICLQTGVLGNIPNGSPPAPQSENQNGNQLGGGTGAGEVVGNEENGSVPPVLDDNYQVTEEKFRNCSSIYPLDISFVCESDLFYSGALNFPAHVFRTAEENSGHKCKIPPNPKIFKKSTETLEMHGITFKNHYWVGNDKCLSQTVLDQAKQHGIEVIYQKNYFENILKNHHLPTGSVTLKNNNHSFIRIINFNLSWKNPAETYKTRGSLIPLSGDSINMTFLALKPEAIFQGNNLTVAKVPFVGKGNLFALFVQSTDRIHPANIENITQNLVPVIDDKESYLKIPVIPTWYSYGFSLRRCPFEEVSKTNQKTEHMQNVYRFDLNDKGLGVKASTPISLKQNEAKNVITFDRAFQFLLMRGTDNFPIFHQNIDI